MGSLTKTFLTGFGLLFAFAVPGFAQDSGVNMDVGNILFGISVLLIAVSFMIVMVKVARFMDVLTDRMDKDKK